MGRWPPVRNRKAKGGDRKPEGGKRFQHSLFSFPVSAFRSVTWSRGSGSNLAFLFLDRATQKTVAIFLRIRNSCGKNGRTVHPQRASTTRATVIVPPTSQPALQHRNPGPPGTSQSQNLNISQRTHLLEEGEVIWGRRVAAAEFESTNREAEMRSPSVSASQTRAGQAVPDALASLA